MCCLLADSHCAVISLSLSDVPDWSPPGDRLCASCCLLLSPRTIVRPSYTSLPVPRVTVLAPRSLWPSIYLYIHVCMCAVFLSHSLYLAVLFTPPCTASLCRCTAPLRCGRSPRASALCEVGRSSSTTGPTTFRVTCPMLSRESWLTYDAVLL